MTKMRMLWFSLGLSALAFLMIWLGTYAGPILLWAGLFVFVLAMLLGPATRYIG